MRATDATPGRARGAHQSLRARVSRSRSPTPLPASPNRSASTRRGCPPPSRPTTRRSNPPDRSTRRSSRAAEPTSRRREATGPQPWRRRCSTPTVPCSSAFAATLSCSGYSPPGCGTAMTSSPSIPAKSAGLHVYTESPLDSAIAAIIASKARAAGLRPARRSDAATMPNARAAGASSGSASKSASAACRCAWRAARSSSVAATRGPTDNSANVTAVMSGSSGKASISAIRPRRMSVLVSRTPRVVVTATCRCGRRCPCAALPDRRREGSGGERSAARGVTTVVRSGISSATGRPLRVIVTRSPRRDSVDDIATMVAQIADRDSTHSTEMYHA